MQLHRVLIVDDDRDTLDFLAAALRDEGIEADTAMDGQDALDALRTHALPDVILLDLIMPRLNGFEFRRQQLADERIAMVPVVVITGWTSRLDELGETPRLAKPFALEELLRAVKRAVAGAECCAP
jgi:two-component system response regulator MprA